MNKKYYIEIKPETYRSDVINMNAFRIYIDEDIETISIYTENGTTMHGWRSSMIENLIFDGYYCSSLGRRYTIESHNIPDTVIRKMKTKKILTFL